MTIAITGATGFVGQALLDRAATAGIEVRALTRREQPPRDGVEWVRGDLDDQAALRQLCRGAEAIIHVAGVVNAPDAAGFERGNVTGTLNVIEAARYAGVPRLVHVSSLSAREPDLSVYGASKARAEKLVRASGIDWTIVRPPGIYGPRDTEYFEMFRLARWGVLPVPPREGRSSLIHVDDLARLLLALLPGAAHLLVAAVFALHRLILHRLLLHRLALLRTALLAGLLLATRLRLVAIVVLHGSLHLDGRTKPAPALSTRQGRSVSGPAAGRECDATGRGPIRPGGPPALPSCPA